MDRYRNPQSPEAEVQAQNIAKLFKYIEHTENNIKTSR
jgi:hypothetical protein